MKVRDDKLEFQVGSSEQKKVLSLIKTPFTRFWPIKVSIRSLPMLLNLQLCKELQRSKLSNFETRTFETSELQANEQHDQRCCLNCGVNDHLRNLRIRKSSAEVSSFFNTKSLYAVCMLFACSLYAVSLAL